MRSPTTRPFLSLLAGAEEAFDDTAFKKTSVGMAAALRASRPHARSMARTRPDVGTTGLACGIQGPPASARRCRSARLSGLAGDPPDFADGTPVSERASRNRVSGADDRTGLRSLAIPAPVVLKCLMRAVRRNPCTRPTTYRHQAARDSTVKVGESQDTPASWRIAAGDGHCEQLAAGRAAILGSTLRALSRRKW